MRRLPLALALVALAAGRVAGQSHCVEGDGTTPRTLVTAPIDDARLLILDEGQNAKSPRARRTRSCQKLARLDGARTLVMTGTP